MEKTIEELEKELEELEASNKSAWDTYGSELCAGDMSGQENALRDKITELKLGYPKNIQKLELDDDLLLAIIGGDGERVTVRNGRRDIKFGQLLFKGVRDSGLKYIVEVTEVRYVKVFDVSEDIIKAEGFTNWSDFYKDMEKYYPDLDIADECTVVFFKIADVTTQ